MQDNAPCHASQATQNWLDSIGVVKLEWPPQSPDMNPIENIWQQVKSKLHKQHPDLRRLTGGKENIEKKLAERVEQVWAEIDSSSFETLVQSMPARMQAVIDAKGSWTKY